MPRGAGSFVRGAGRTARLVDIGLVPVVAITFSLVAVQATTAAPAKQPGPDPADAQAAVPALVYKPPLANYRSLGDEAPADWRQANDTVRAVGGWRAYAREAARDPQAPANAASQPAPKAVAKP
jgi:hypothetical protein